MLPRWCRPWEKIRSWNKRTDNPLSAISKFNVGLPLVNLSIMSDDLAFILEEAQDSMKKGIQHLEAELIKIRAGKASPQMLEGLVVDYYGTPTALNQVGNVSVMDA